MKVTKRLLILVRRQRFRGDGVERRDLERGCRQPGRRCAGGGGFVAVLVSCLTLGVALSSVTVLADSITFTDGRRVEGCVILAAQWDGIQYRLSDEKSPQRVGGAKVLSIERDTQNSDLTRGRKALDGGSHEDAIELLSRVKGAGAKWEQAEAAFRIGEAHAAKGDGKSAEDQYKAYLKEYEDDKDWFIPWAIVRLGSEQIDRKQFESAAKTLKRLESFPSPWPDRAALGRARAVIRAKKKDRYTAVQEALGKVARRRAAPQDVRDEAYVLRGEIFLARKQNDRAIQELTGVFFNPSKARETRYSKYRAVATLLVGQAYRASGDKKGLETAEIWLLKVPALYPNQGAYSEVYRDACKALAKVYAELGHKERAKEWKARVRGRKVEG